MITFVSFGSGQCCHIDILNDIPETVDNFEPGQLDIFQGEELSGCNGFDLAGDTIDRILLIQCGGDSWKPEWVTVLFEDGTFRRCVNTNNASIENRQALELNCNAE